MRQRMPSEAQHRYEVLRALVEFPEHVVAASVKVGIHWLGLDLRSFGIPGLDRLPRDVADRDRGEKGVTIGGADTHFANELRMAGHVGRRLRPNSIAHTPADRVDLAGRRACFGIGFEDMVGVSKIWLVAKAIPSIRAR
jgi:hypothetical protein